MNIYKIQIIYKLYSPFYGGGSLTSKALLMLSTEKDERMSEV